MSKVETKATATGHGGRASDSDKGDGGDKGDENDEGGGGDKGNGGTEGYAVKSAEGGS